MGLSGLKCTRMGACVKAVLRFRTLWCDGAPGERGVLVGEANQGDDNVGEPHDESAIKVSEGLRTPGLP